MRWRTAISVGFVAALAVAGCGVEREDGAGLGRAAPSTSAPRPTSTSTSTTPDDGGDDEGDDEDRAPDGGSASRDEALDALQVECEDGDDRACDLLFLTSPIGSDHEAVGERCAGRDRQPSGFCSPEAEWGDDGFAPEDSPGMAVLATDCEAGDPTACDLLFELAAPDTALEETGQTCGGEVPGGATPDCRTELGG